MANGFIHHCCLLGRPRFGPFVIFISTQISTIFFRVPFTLRLCFFAWNLLKRVGISTSKLCIYLRWVVVRQVLLWILHLLPYTLLKTYASLSGICLNARCIYFSSICGPLSLWFGSSLCYLFHSFILILLTAYCIRPVKSPAMRVSVWFGEFIGIRANRLRLTRRCFSMCYWSFFDWRMYNVKQRRYNGITNTLNMFMFIFRWSYFLSP
jgi:hypothetical protein